MAASAAALFPILSVPEVGGPTVPVTTLNFADKVPLLVVLAKLLRGLVQDTETGLPSTWMVGWLASLLHSTIPPIVPLASPEPVTVTVWSLVNPVLGLTVRLAAAAALPDKLNIVITDNTRLESSTLLKTTSLKVM